MHINRQKETSLRARVGFFIGDKYDKATRNQSRIL